MMGALKIPIIKSGGANNVSYSGVGLRKPTSKITDTSSVIETVGKEVAFTVAKRVIPKLYPPLMIASLLYDVGSLGYEAYKSYMQNNDVPNTDNPSEFKDESGTKTKVKEVPETVLKKVIEQKKQKEIDLKTDTDNIITNLQTDVSTTLPDIMKANTLSLVTAINSLTNVVNSNMHELNLNLLGMGMQVSQGNDLSELVSGQDQLAKAMEYSQPINKINLTTQNVTNNVNPELSLPETLSNKWSASLDKRIVKDDAVIEDLDFRKQSVSIEDLDGNVVASKSPREIEMMKNAGHTRKVTDENNFELDDDDFDIMSMPDISSMFSFKTANQDIEDLYNNFKGGA